MCLASLVPEKISRRNLLRGLAASGLGSVALPLLRQGAAAPFDDGAAMRAKFEALRTAAPADPVSELVPFSLQADELPWKQLAMNLEAGDEVTFLLGGRYWLSREADLWFEPGCVFHARCGSNGTMYNPMRNHGTFSVEQSGRLEIARSAAEWLDAAGNLRTPEAIYRQADLSLHGLAIRWRGTAREGLLALLAQGDVDGLLEKEHARLISRQDLPDGWRDHFNTGSCENTFQPNATGGLICETNKDAALLVHDVDIHLEKKPRLDWRWKVDRLPSPGLEDQLALHDYLSVAVEFDDGQDLTWLWSTGLPVDKGFRCPIPGWDAIETHVVVRSGSEDLGTWQDEHRDIASDYRRYIGGDATRVVRVWLLGLSVFQRGHGTCHYERVVLRGSDGERSLLG